LNDEKIMLSTHLISAGADANKLVRATVLSSMKFKPSSSWPAVFAASAQQEGKANKINI
jgi:hypothetical protein